MPLIPLQSITDPRLADYRAIKDRQHLPEFSLTHNPTSSTPHGKFMAEGEVVLHKLAISPFRTLSVLTAEARVSAIQPHLDQLPPETPIYTLPLREIETLVGFSMHRGLLAIGARNPPTPAADLLALVQPFKPLIVLEDLVNHDNIGGIFRSAAALGAAGVLMTHATADPLYRKALRVSAGCALITPMTKLAPNQSPIPLLTAANITTLALTPAADSIDLRDLHNHIDLTTTRLALMLGTEGPGLSASALQSANLKVRIPINAHADSLNVSVTAGIVLHALSRPT